MSANLDPSPDLEDLLQAYRKLVTRLRRSEALGRGDVDAAFRQVTELAAQVLRVDRASVWRLTAEGKRIECVDLFIRATGEHVKDFVLDKANAQTYFNALDTERCIVAHDARTDLRTSSLSDYLIAHKIGAMLDAPVFLHGAMSGVVCHEHIGGPRQWQLWEELVAGTMADFVALVMEAGERVKAEAEMAKVREHLEQERAMRTVFEAAPVPLVLARVDGTIELFNARAKAVIGVPDDFAPGSVRAERFYANAADRERILAEVRAGTPVDNRELLMRAWDGDERWCLCSVRVVPYRGHPHVMMGFSEIGAQKELESRLRDAATHDPLTSLHNRRHFFDNAAKELERAKRYGRPLSLAMLDADHFKAKNDEYGHVIGDELLIAFAKVASSELRQSDLIARYGGEEIVILFPETDLDAAFVVTDRIRRRLGEFPITTAAGPITMTCSGGVVGWNNEETLPQLIDRADQSLYAAKAAGRDRVRAS
jgi:diguanylate cyclase (GGDEF)-like protein/PAS domain S-box-containing protein